MKLNIKPLSISTEQYYKNKLLNYKGDCGFDLFVIEDITIPPHQTVHIDFNIQCEPFSNNGYYLYPRSSISKTPLRMANSVGIIDPGYRGNIMAAVDNISNVPYTVCKGIRLFQLCSPNLEPLEIKLVNELSNSERGEGGFGSTGE